MKDKSNKDNKIQPNQGPKDQPKALFSTQNVVSVYTAFAILLKMKNTLGLEAMLEFLKDYTQTLEKYNPKLKSAVLKALNLVSIEKIYEDGKNVP